MCSFLCTVLQKPEFDTPVGLKHALSAAQDLEALLNAKLLGGMNRMKAVQSQKLDMGKLKKEFCKLAANFFDVSSFLRFVYWVAGLLCEVCIRVRQWPLLKKQAN